MSDAIQVPFILVGLAVCGAAFTFGVVTVCRLMKWSPINITINVHQGDRDAD